jgi:2-dehydro-3-deoxyphosphogluconate aldolase/(4S)-4-hydroxy-2-oxoglutarate aldolase
MRTITDLKTRVARSGIIPIVRTHDRALAYDVTKKLIRAGLSCVEVTLTVPAAVELIKDLIKEFGDQALIGAGTVLTVSDAKRCIDAGASFIVSPITDLGIVEICQSAGVVVMAGALTPTEIFAAWRAGADFVKIFPVSAVGGAGYVKAIRSVFPEIDIVPTGGISISDAESFLAAGAAAVGIGSELTNSSLVADSDSSELRDIARRFAKD